MDKLPKIFRSAVDKKYYPYSGNPEQARRYEAAGVIVPADIADIEAVTILDEVFGIARPLYVLREACRKIGMDTLEHRIDVATKLTGTEKVPPMEEAEIKTQAYTDVDFKLWKNVAHVVVADESQKKAAHDILGMNVEDCAGALALMENAQIAAIAEAATNTSAGADWGTITDGRSANSPYADIMTAFATIEGTGGYNPDFILAHPYVWMDFFGNDFVKGQLKGEVLPAGKIFDVPGLPGVRGLSDWSLTSTQCLVIASRLALILGEGPIAAAKYRNEKAGYDAYIIRQWLEPKIVVQNSIYELTGVHA